MQARWWRNYRARKAKLIGHVGRVDKFVIAGWAMNDENPAARPELVIVQQGEPVISFRPQFAYPSLLSERGLPATQIPPIYAFRLWFPLSNGLQPDVPFEIQFRQTGAPLPGVDGFIANAAQTSPKVLRELREGRLALILHRGEPNRVAFTVQASTPHGRQSKIVTGASERPVSAERVQGPNFPLGIDTVNFAFALEREVLERDGAFCLPVGLESCREGELPFHDALRSKAYVPRTVFRAEERIAGIPDQSHTIRVAGVVDEAQFLIGGATSFMQINAILLEHARRQITEFPVVVDWGVGCGRVIRHFVETAPQVDLGSPAQQRIGLDIDEFNIKWCRDNLGPDVGRFDVLSLEGFDLPDSSVDLLYGISVMTHLSEANQDLWLSEIRRVLRPGGFAILTVHGEAHCYVDPQHMANPFVEKFGFFDGVPDHGLGESMSTYYRGAYHARSYIESHWSKYLDILDVIPMAMYTQDYVVLRKPPGPTVSGRRRSE